MSSQRKIDSARANGAKSHGPKTEQGRKKSAMNALTHGLYASSVVLSTESPDEYRQLLEAYLQQLQPVGEVEFDLVEEMVAAKWQQRRLRAIESDLLELEMMQQEKRLDEKYSRYDEIVKVASAYSALALYPALPLLTRHQSSLERAYSRSLKNLLNLQRLRKAEPADGQNLEERTESQLRTPSAAVAPPSENPRPTTHPFGPNGHAAALIQSDAPPGFPLPD